MSDVSVVKIFLGCLSVTVVLFSGGIVLSSHIFSLLFSWKTTEGSLHFYVLPWFILFRR